MKRLPGLRSIFEERDWLRREVERLRQYQTWRPPGHYYSPLPDLTEVRERHPKLFNRDVDSVPGINMRAEEQLRLLGELQHFYDRHPFDEQPGDACRYGFSNDWFRHCDALTLYMMLRHLRPRRVIEIGSGYSSAIMLDVRDLFLPEMELTFIDPEIDRLTSLLRPGDEESCTIIQDKVQNLGIDRFAALEEDDILFIDSSHVSKIGSDVNMLMLEVLPRLKPGVYVHIHDVVYPFEYPEQWVYDGWAWNEAYLLRAFLMFNDSFEVVLNPSFLQIKERAYLEQHMPLLLASQAWSFWMKRAR